MVSAVGNGSVPSPQSEAVTSELQELSLQSVPSLLPLKERKNGELWHTSASPLVKLPLKVKLSKHTICPFNFMLYIGLKSCTYIKVQRQISILE